MGVDSYRSDLALCTASNSNRLLALILVGGIPYGLLTWARSTQIDMEEEYWLAQIKPIDDLTLYCALAEFKKNL